MQTYEFSGFPVVQEEMFLGFVGREKLRLALGSPHLILASSVTLTVPIEQLRIDRSPAELARECTFSRTYAASEPDLIDLSSLMEVSVLELRTEVPLELVVNMIHKMVRAFFLRRPSTVQRDVPLLIELATNPFHATGEAYGSDHQVRYRRCVDCAPAA